MEVGGDRRSAELHAALSKQGWVGTQGIWEFECRVSHLGGGYSLEGGGGMDKGGGVKAGCCGQVGVGKRGNVGMVVVIEEGERQIQRETERHRETERDTETQRQRDREKDKDRKKERQINCVRCHLQSEKKKT